MSNSPSPLFGYPRPDGRWGFRNHILILPLHQALSTAARDIAEATSGAVAISHDWSGEIDKDFERITKTFAGFAGNPNIFTTVALTIGTEVESGIIERAKKFSPTPLVEIKLSDAGSMFKLVTNALEKVTELAEQAAAQSRAPSPWSAVVL